MFSHLKVAALVLVVALSPVLATQTVTVTKTVTAAPTSCTSSSILTFDDLSCVNFCPFPSTYKGFVFNGASGWQVVTKSALPSARNENLAVVSQPNALISQSTGPVNFGSQGQGFSFDIVRFEWSVFSIDNTTDVTLFMVGTTVSGALRHYNVTLPSGINIAPYMTDFTGGPALDFNNLVDISFAAWSRYPTTPTPAVLIIDDFSYIKRIGF